MQIYSKHSKSSMFVVIIIMIGFLIIDKVRRAIDNRDLGILKIPGCGQCFSVFGTPSSQFSDAFYFILMALMFRPQAIPSRLAEKKAGLV